MAGDDGIDWNGMEEDQYAQRSLQEEKDQEEFRQKQYEQYVNDMKSLCEEIIADAQERIQSLYDLNSLKQVFIYFLIQVSIYFLDCRLENIKTQFYSDVPRTFFTNDDFVDAYDCIFKDLNELIGEIEELRNSRLQND
jgi:hypothetical protein